MKLWHKNSSVVWQMLKYKNKFQSKNIIVISTLCRYYHLLTTTNTSKFHCFRCCLTHTHSNGIWQSRTETPTEQTPAASQSVSQWKLRQEWLIFIQYAMIYWYNIITGTRDELQFKWMEVQTRHRGDPLTHEPLMVLDQTPQLFALKRHQLDELSMRPWCHTDHRHS